MDWAPKVVRAVRPPQATLAASPVAVMASLNDFASNFGHSLYDFLFPVFNQMQLMGLYHPNFQLLLAQHQVLLSFPSKPQQSLYKGTTLHSGHLPRIHQLICSLQIVYISWSMPTCRQHHPQADLSLA